MPKNDLMEALRPELVESWNKKQSLLRSQESQFLAGAQTATASYLRHAGFQSIILKVLHERPGHLSHTKWENGLPMDGEEVPGFEPVFCIDHSSLSFNGKNSYPGFRNQLIGRAGDPTIIVIVSILREMDTIYHIIHFISEDGLTHEPKEAWLDSRTNVDLEPWLRQVMSEKA